MPRKATLFLIILTLFFTGACIDTSPYPYIIKTNKPLFVQTTAGTEVIDVSKLEVISDEFMDISSGGYGITASKKFLYLSDSGTRTEFIKIGGNQLHQLNISKGTVKTIKAPSVDDLIVYRKKVYGLSDQKGLGFIYDEKKGKLRKFRIEDDLALSGFVDAKPLVYDYNALGFFDKDEMVKRLTFDRVITQAILYSHKNKKMIAAFVGPATARSKINIISLPNFTILKKFELKPKNDALEEVFIYENKLYYSSTRPEGNTYFKSDYIFNVLDLSSYKVVDKVKLPALPNGVLHSKGKLYFSLIEGRKKSNMLIVVDSKTSKILKELEIGKNVSDMMLIKDKLFVGAIDSRIIRVIDVDKLEIEKTLQLEGDPVRFATPLSSTQATGLGI